jgi:hypothetical protein
MKLGINMPWVCTVWIARFKSRANRKIPLRRSTRVDILNTISPNYPMNHYISFRNTSTFTVLYTEQAMKQWNWWWIAPSSTIPREGSSVNCLWIIGANFFSSGTSKSNGWKPQLPMAITLWPISAFGILCGTKRTSPGCPGLRLDIPELSHHSSPSSGSP